MLEVHVMKATMGTCRCTITHLLTIRALKLSHSERSAPPAGSTVSDMGLARSVQAVSTSHIAPGCHGITGE